MSEQDQLELHQAAVEALARRRDCTVVGATAPPDGAPAALLAAAGFARATDGDRWVHRLD
ncbi:MAG: hypothetical protein ABL966_16835 [Acidimicrobiales bacterium]